MRDEKNFFTLAGTKHYYGSEFFKPEMRVQIEKEEDNEYDTEAIVVKVEGLGKVGYVANSPFTVLGESMSAGRIYDKIGKKAFGEVVFVMSQGVLCKLDEKSLLDWQQD